MTKYYNYSKCKKWIQKKNLNCVDDWREFSRTKRPTFIPSDPPRRFKDKWEGWPTFLGYATKRNIHTNRKALLDYNSAKKIVHKLNLKQTIQYIKMANQNKLPPQVPHAPDIYYKKNGMWKDWTDYLGNFVSRKKIFMNYKMAKNLIRRNNITTEHEYQKFRKDKPNLPSDPSKQYKEWEGYPEFFGIKKRIKTNNIVSFKECKKLANQLGIKTKEQWFEHWKKHKRPTNIPLRPDVVYKRRKKID